MFMAGVIIFAITSATAGIAQDPAMLIGSRAIQGIGAALMMPATLSIITNTFPAAERGRAIGIWAGVSALALSIGPVVGGALTEYVSWRAIFFINLPVAAGAIAATIFAVRESRDETIGRRVDYPGVFALTASLTAIVLALIEGNSWGWTSTSILGLLAGGLIGLAIFVAIELRVSAPMVEFALFKTRQFIGSNLVAFIITFAMMGTFFFMAIYMQDILGYGALEAGIRFLPTTIVIAVVAPISGRLADRLGPATPMSAGLAILAVSMFLFAGINTGTTYSGLVIPFVLMGLGIALTMSPMSTAAMNAVSAQKSGVASGVLQMSRMIGASVGVAATGAIFQAQLGSGFDPAKLATAPEQARATFIDALGSAMLLAAFVVVAGLVVALTLVRGARAKRADSQEAAEESVAAVPEASVAEDVVPAGAR
jgi:EmrB/QacA subfamily drug resistance transporter